MMSHNGTSLLDGLTATDDGSAALVKMTRDRAAVQLSSRPSAKRESRDP
jgi:hypothetical protein